MNLLPGCQFNADGVTVPDQDAPQLDAAPDFAPMLSDVGNEATRETGAPADGHLRLGAGGHGAVEVGPPFKGAPVAQDHGNVEFRFEITDTVAFQFEVAIPGHRGERAMEERMRVISEARQPRMLECHQSAARNFGTIQRQRFQSAARQVSLQDQSIVPGAKNDAVESGIHITQPPTQAGCRSGPRRRIPRMREAPLSIHRSSCPSRQIVSSALWAAADASLCRNSARMQGSKPAILYQSGRLPGHA